MLQQDQPDDYVVATGETHSVREFIELAFGYANLDYQKYVKIDPQLYRPAEVDVLVGNPAKAQSKLAWSSQTRFETLVQEMVKADCAALKLDIAPSPLAASN